MKVTVRNWPGSGFRWRGRCGQCDRDRKDGSWSLSERPDGDGDPAEVDSGILQVNERGDDQYFAVSEQFDDVFYPITLAEPGAMYWGYTNKYYERSE